MAGQGYLGLVSASAAGHEISTSWGLGPVKKRLAALFVALAAVILSTLTAAPPSSATRYPLGTQCVTIVHRAKLRPHDEEQRIGIVRSVDWGFGAELDARVTSDGRLVMVHDDNLRRISGGRETRAAEAMTFAEVRATRLAGGGQVMTFGEAVLAARESGARLLVEIKRHDDYRRRWDEIGLPAIARTLRRLGMTQRVFVGGAGSVTYHEQAPANATFFRTDPVLPLQLRWIIDHGYDLVQLDANHLTAPVIAQLRAAGITVGTRQVNDVAAVEAAYDAGLRLFQANRGEMAAKWCAQRKG